MANIFFDTNYFINLHTKRAPTLVPTQDLEKHDLYVSALTYHIFAYLQKIKIPSKELKNTLEKFYISDFTEDILAKAMDGPTNNLEDNIQLHSATKADCDYLLTNDQRLLKMKFFGKTRIVNSLS